MLLFPYSPDRFLLSDVLSEMKLTFSNIELEDSAI